MHSTFRLQINKLTNSSDTSNLSARNIKNTQKMLQNNLREHS